MKQLFGSCVTESRPVCEEGHVVPYERYRAHFPAQAGLPVHWSWSFILAALAQTPAAERGSLTLSSSTGPAGCELLPGMAINIQLVPAGSSTRAHSHSWWHLFFVRTGVARADLGRQGSRKLASGDLLLVPAWCEHAFHNDGREDLVLLSMSNLPQQAALSNHLAYEPDDRSLQAAAQNLATEIAETLSGMNDDDVISAQ